MPTRKVTPLAQLDRRIPEAGRIRMGHKAPMAGKDKNGDPKTRQEALDKFRFTAPRREILDQLAALYGGEVTAWHDAKASPPNQFQLYSKTDSIRVLLMPDGITQYYEMWSGGGNKRRCDGVTVTVPEKTSEYDYELVEKPCLCDAEGKLSCKVKTRLSVILPDVGFAGSWRLETSGQNAAEELPGMAALIETVRARGAMVQALLSLEQRNTMTEVGARHFVVPKLTVEESPIALSQGQAAFGQIGGTPSAGQRALGSGPGGQPAPAEPEIAEAELLTPEMEEVEERLKADAVQFGFDPHAYLDAVRAQCGGDYERMALCSTKVRAEQLEPIGWVQGKIQWKAL